ncbi:TonB-dependent receptor [Neptunomonas qingdaonensis]|uniref:Catecholate siderophore receptor n=1 Tax=Neptunomonas qingdaonensis TaxID=1045558 RepID=A0A1I2LXE1_9GAMM|nr:TonB-dependent siderophore receptor [Neptunomonas qingdaonensis]SFF83190.1 catecholate siderophore receptor [Neptunomonas qingdaonensis]
MSVKKMGDISIRGNSIRGSAIKGQESTEGQNLSMVGTLAFAISAAMVGPAQAAGVTLDTLIIGESVIEADANPYSEPGAPYKAKRLSDTRHTRDIADTPQTVTVLTKETIAESGKTELKDILSAQPGITLGTGEGGNSFGDRYIIRGYEARSDVYTDGLREPGLITRETFALEQIEVSKGSSSTFGGRGSTGGAVNSVTKKATLEENFTTLEGGLGTDKYKRGTLDTNYVVNDDLAVRLNLLYTDADIPDRAPAKENRQGALISAVYQATDKLKVSADFYHFEGDDKTDVGVALDRTTGVIDSERQYVGQDGLDFQETQADIATLKLDLDINDEIRLENKTRLGSTSNDYIVSAYNSNSSRFPGGLRTFTGWQENDYLGNQTNLIIDKNLNSQRHTIIAGVEYANEETKAGNYSVTTDSVNIDPYNTNNTSWIGSYNKSAAATQLSLDTVSVYLMDTVTLNDDWEVFAGVRYDYFDYSLDVAATATKYQFSDGFWNSHSGVVFSPWKRGNVYASWSTSSNINGGEADAGTNCGYGGLCTDADGNYQGADPEQSTNLEIGTKWNLMDEKLLLSAAVFRTTKDDVIEGDNDSYASNGSLNTGKNRVEGVELGVSGNITAKLSAQFGVAIMDSETLKSYDDANVGKPKANFADNSANLQLRYQATPKLALGGVVTYSSEIYGGQPDAGASETIELPDYTVYDLFASYQVNKQLSLRANIQNLTNEDYYTAVYRGGSIVYLGDARSANLTMTYKF